MAEHDKATEETIQLMIGAGASFSFVSARRVNCAVQIAVSRGLATRKIVKNKCNAGQLACY
jgi:hypothetical protein